MMSNISFYKLLREDIKKRIWLLWLSIAIFFLVLPVTSMMQIDNVLHWSGEDLTYVKEWFVDAQIGNMWMGVFLVGGALIAAISSLSHLHSRQQLDFYHSLPVKREEWFLVSYVSSFVQVMIPYIFCCIGCYVIGKMKGITSGQSWDAFVYTVGISVVCYHLVYVVSAIGMIVTGKLLLGVFMIVFFQLWYPFVVSLKEMVMGSVFETYLSMNATTGIGFAPFFFQGKGWEFSPIFLYHSWIRNYFDNTEDGPSILLVIVIGIVLWGLAFVLYKKRPSEAAGKSVAFPILEPVTKVLIAVALGVFFANMSYSQYELIKRVPIWSFIVGSFAAAFVCLVVEFIYSADIRMFLQRKMSVLISVAGTVLLCLIFQYDLFGYDSYIPKKTEIAAMSIDLLYDNLDVFENSATYEGMDEGKRLEKLHVTDFGKIYQTVQNGIKNNQKEEELWNNEHYVPVKVAFYLKTGNVIYRKYYVENTKMYRCMESLMADREYRRKYFGIDQVEKEKFLPGSVDMYLGRQHTFSIPQEKQQSIMKTFFKELETKPFSVFENANLVGNLHFYADEDDYIDFPIYEEFTETLNLLKKQFPGWKKLEKDDVVFMSAEYLKNVGNEEEVIKKTIKEEDIQEVLDSLCYVQTGFLSRIAEKDIYITIETTMGNVYHYYIRKENIPDCLAKW